MKTVKIKELHSPGGDIAQFDPAAHLSQLDYHESEEPVTDKDRKSLADFLHYLAHIAQHYQSPHWEKSCLKRGTQAYEALTSHFGHLEGWGQIAQEELLYKAFVAFIEPHYKPAKQNGHAEAA